MVFRVISKNNLMEYGLLNEDNGEVSKETSGTLVEQNSFQALADLEEGEIYQTVSEIDLNGGKTTAEVTKELEKDTINIESEGIASVSTKKCVAENNVNVDSAVRNKKKRSKQLKELGPINSSTRSRRLVQ
ncbi:hypothetical protein MA16_Dca019074 [Dendrobium catenatum]|uniref:Uncharacterized protein n=1 Tax=Dendrobium catenatum TaxID=906689 RepID=A0A2I0VU95_9ASPA|nr:hypothetical protein MA16_Dca019074 [Dendrobium catenatum]